MRKFKHYEFRFAPCEHGIRILYGEFCARCYVRGWNGKPSPIEAYIYDQDLVISERDLYKTLKRIANNVAL